MVCEPPFPSAWRRRALFVSPDDLSFPSKLAPLQFRVDHQMQLTDASADAVQQALLELVEATRLAELRR